MADRNSVEFAREKALTISFVERGFGRLGLDRQAVGFSWCSYKVKFSFTPGVFLMEVGWEALVFGHFSQPLLQVTDFSFYTRLCSLSFVHV